ncbi:hypothetical protein B0H11DRAFT_1712883, partial [Mycena galericulata]
AFHDSAERYPQPKCHPETRKQILDSLWNWACETDPSSNVLWLHGPAGAGKSAVAQSFCQRLETAGRLGGSFFFRRGHLSRGNSQKLFSTLAYQLAPPLPFQPIHLPESRENPSILDRSFSRQVRELIIEPSRRHPGVGTLVIVIDGLDECDGQDVQQEILRSIGSTIQGLTLPLRFLIGGRPEPHIADIFRTPSLKKGHRPFNIRQANVDVRKYLLDEFKRIHRDHRETMATLHTPWPSSEIVEELVHKSSGYFIYASTVIKFIDDKNFRPTERLEIIMGLWWPVMSARSDGGSTWALQRACGLCISAKMRAG